MTSLSSNVLRFAVAAIALGTPVFAGCGAAPDGQIGMLSSSMIEDNALTANALNANALNANALSPQALSMLQNTGTNGALSRQLLKYTVGCAFRPDQSFNYTWTDDQGSTHSETLWGILGLAPQWATGPIDANAQGWMSACLASRTNYFGVTVMLSARGATNGLDNVDSYEGTNWSNVEGAFWGNTFDPGGRLYTCYKSANVAHSRALNRVCSSGYPDGQGGVVECTGIKIVGDCDDVCTTSGASSGYYASCTGPGGTTSKVFTIFLQ